MRPIVAEIHTLIQYLKIIKEDPKQLRPKGCPHCGKKDPNCHGHYTRKSDKENTSQNSLNPIPIFRFYCVDCKRTCSVLPECIPARRWYLWAVQQLVLTWILTGKSYRKISQQLLPNRKTISRWYNWFVAQFQLHVMHLKSCYSWLGYGKNFKDFWLRCFSKLKLSTAMMFLNNLGVVIP